MSENDWRHSFLVSAAAAVATAVFAYGQIDLSNDGRLEVAFGSPGAGSFLVLDGASGGELWRVTGSGSFGWAATAHPDIDGDGRPDVLVAAPGDQNASTGRVVALRGGDGTTLWECAHGAPQARFGLGLGVVPDQDGDQVADLVVAMLSEDDPSGEVGVVVSARTGSVHRTEPGPMASVLTALRKQAPSSGALPKRSSSVLVVPPPGCGGEFPLLSLEDPLRYNDGERIVAAAKGASDGFQPTPQSVPCWAEYDAARLAKLEWARHMLAAPFGLIFSLKAWREWSLRADQPRDRFYYTLAVLNACRAQHGLRPLSKEEILGPGKLEGAPGPSTQPAADPPAPPCPPPPPGSPSQCPLDDSYPPPAPSPGSPQDPCFNQLETNILVCLACRDLNLAAESYSDCLERAKRIFLDCRGRVVGGRRREPPLGLGAAVRATSVSIEALSTWVRSVFSVAGGSQDTRTPRGGLACRAPETAPQGAEPKGVAELKRNTSPKRQVTDSQFHVPEIQFLLPRPVPFRMDSSLPGAPSVIELAPIAFGTATRARIRQVLEREMAKYPPGTLGVADLIIIGSTLEHNGRRVGGVYDMGLIFMAAGEADRGPETDADVARIFHHEVAHGLQLWYGSSFDEARFRAALPPGFVYRDELPDHQPQQQDGAPRGFGTYSLGLEQLEEGFLSPWAREKISEDVSYYAQQLLCRPALVLDLFAPDSRVGRKARVVRDFYAAIDPRFAALFERDARREPPHGVTACPTSDAQTSAP